MRSIFDFVKEDIVKGVIPEVMNDSVAIIDAATDTHYCSYPPLSLESSNITR